MLDNIFFFIKLKNDVRFFYDSLTLRQGLELMRAHGYSAVPVLDGSGVYVGSVSEGDFLWYLIDHKGSQDILDTAHIGDLVRPGFMPPVSIDIPFTDLLDTSLHQNYVPVVDDRNIFIGIVTRQAILHYFIEQGISMQPEKVQPADMIRSLQSSRRPPIK